jgi:hypothetical protein
VVGRVESSKECTLGIEEECPERLGWSLLGPLEGFPDGNADILGEMLCATLGLSLVDSVGVVEVVLGVADGLSDMLGPSLRSVLGPLEGFPDGNADMLGEMLCATVGFSLVDSEGVAEVVLGVAESRSKPLGSPLRPVLGSFDCFPAGKTDMRATLGFALLNSDGMVDVVLGVAE